MRLYTKGGDGGQTGLWGGARVFKDDVRVASYGEVDQTCAVVGWAMCASVDDLELREQLTIIQSDLFVLGAQLARVEPASGPSITTAQVARLERWIDEATAETPPLNSFILPGGCELAARLHVARTTARRAERAVVTLSRTVELPPECLQYINRLSDLLFALARRANHRSNAPDIPWRP